MSRRGCIYQIENTMARQIYIGQTVDYTLRVKDHLARSDYGQELLYRAMRKYGKDNFRFSVLLLCDEKNLDFYETLLIDKLKTHRFTHGSGYNMTLGGSSVRGSVRSDESKIRYSESKMGEKNPRYGSVGTMLGKKHTEDTKQRLSKAKTGVKITADKAKKLHDSRRYIGDTLPDDVRYQNLLKYHAKPLEVDGKYFINLYVVSKFSGYTQKVFKRLIANGLARFVSMDEYLANKRLDPVICEYYSGGRLTDFLDIQKANCFSDDFLYKLQASKNVYVKSDDWKAKVSLSNSGKSPSEETRSKISKTLGTPVEYQGLTFDSRKKAANHFGVDVGFINRRIKDGSAKLL